MKTQGVAEDLALEIINRYLLVILHEKLYGYAITNYHAHRAVFGMIKDRSEAGVSREAEVDQADARLALAESNKISAEANLQEARINYAKVVGKWPGKLVWPRVPTHQDLPRSFYMAALVAKRYNKALHCFVNRLQIKGKTPKTIICAVMRKLAHIIFGVLKNNKPFNENWACF
ncbi:TolC family protein [Legionella sp. 31fI33]|uniref:TolC family protein n=1 Tax=Legionella sp. 31fI33 TaxID=2886376 RepID=UPI001E384EF7|nr:TolC family protein [Legionella sp. 31fI33]MCC5016249.1 TolC family protein [Legionella sp. 31fI33]